MTEVAIHFQNVSKQFTLHRDRPRSLQELFLSWRRYRRPKPEKFWVLRDVSFQVAKGETLGIIGPNGVGKSTVLKLIAGIIFPSAGQIKVSGRVSSLLELGAGFHPDLTGRENIFLYGSLLGLNRAMMQRRFDQIVEFSELEAFIDVPVKTYSSGMYLRLAFSVAIHVDPQVLLIDEILAVGDQSFQAKCLERLSALQSADVTILLVSHGLDSVRQLCSRAIWMQGGKILAQGATEFVVQQYLNAVARQQSAQLAVRNLRASEQERESRERTSGQSARWGSGEIEITRVCVLDSSGQERYVFVTDEELTIQMCYRAVEPVENPVFGLALHRSDGFHITGPNTQFSNVEIPVVEGEGVISYTISRLPLLPGRYQISVAARDAADTCLFDYHDRLYSFSVNPGGTQERYGLIRMEGRWRRQ
jgi:ABC-type polysaccharide/polyol phosphate transport system ATPase subunit